MQNAENNPLASLNLGGLTKLDEQTKEKGVQQAEVGASFEPISLESVRATPPTENLRAGQPDAAAGKAAPASDGLTLGPLAGFPGTWAGPGFNLIEVPNHNQVPHVKPPVDEFKLILNNTHETLTITEIPGGIINRGNVQGDIEYLSLHYLQQVSDVNLPAGNNGIHLETGLLLNLPAGTDPAVAPSVARLGSIPHGDSLLAQGSFTPTLHNQGPDFSINRPDPTPFTVVNGKRVNVTGATYLSLLENPVKVPDGIPQAAVMDPTIILEAAIKGKNITEMTVIFLDANPIEGVSNPDALKDAGSITNIPFVAKNANATTFSGIFWLMTVLNPDNTTTQLLQYIQTVILDFPVAGGQSGQVVDIKWPHISLATLELQSA
ncbi:MAG: heme-binding protein [Janthinobacterium lividum]